MNVVLGKRLIRASVFIYFIDILKDTPLYKFLKNIFRCLNFYVWLLYDYSSAFKIYKASNDQKEFLLFFSFLHWTDK